MPVVYIPDKLIFPIIKMGKDHKEYIRAAIKEKLQRDGVEVEEA